MTTSRPPHHHLHRSRRSRHLRRPQLSATAVRELGLHHPHSKKSRFVTVSYQTVVMEAGAKGVNADEFLEQVLND